jgi:hypothetical protein
MIAGFTYDLRLFVAAVLGLVSIYARLTAAETLRDVKGSPEMRKVVKDTRKARMVNNREDYWLTGMQEGSHFASVWLTKRSPELLLSWLSVNIPKHTTGKPVARREKEFALAKTTISNTSHARVDITILVPHPTYRTMVEYKSLTEFTRYEPPALPVVYHEELPLSGAAATLYQTSRNKCSILIKTAQLGLVNLEVRDCRNKALLISVAKALDFTRLNRKLNS